MLNNIKIGMKLVGGFVIVAFLVVAVGVSGFMALENLMGQTVKIGETILPSVENILAINIGVEKIAKNIIAMSDIDLSSKQIQYYQDQIANARVNYKKALEAYKDVKKTPEQQALWDEFNKVLPSLKADNESFVSMRLKIIKMDRDADEFNDIVRSMNKLQRKSITEKNHQIDEVLEKLIALHKKDADEGVGLARKVKGAAVVLIVIVALMAFVFALMIGIFLTASITKPLSQTMHLMGEMSQGDLTQRLNLTHQDEIGQMAKSMDALTESLSSVIAEISSAADNLQGSTKEVSSGAQQIADGAQQQSASFEELSSSVQSNAENVKNAHQLSQVMSNDAQKAGQAMDNNVEAMVGIEKGSKQMAEAVELISDIADQTNLLALNAAIEAARAGEHGKGFAVVADEVRQLAERSATSAKEIQNLIKENLRQVESGVTISKEAGTIVRGITDSIKKSAEQLQSVAHATQEQAAAMEQNTSITESNASAAEELASSAEQMSLQAQNLKTLVSKFRVNHQVQAASISTQSLRHEAPIKKAPVAPVKKASLGGHKNMGVPSKHNDSKEEKLRIG